MASPLRASIGVVLLGLGACLIPDYYEVEVGTADMDYGDGGNSRFDGDEEWVAGRVGWDAPGRWSELHGQRSHPSGGEWVGSTWVDTLGSEDEAEEPGASVPPEEEKEGFEYLLETLAGALVLAVGTLMKLGWIPIPFVKKNA